MKDENKEILSKLLEYFKESNINDFGYEKDKLISYEEAQILLDYITNLQEENKIVHKDFNELSENYFFTKSRIDKAIEYINTMPLTKGTEWYRIELLDILKGVDKE